ncbi:universal stress protein [Fodinicola acaciae]|uniref:universal stress protein n=1 Tax=Fodinicola acaciae TaxID=2681555 RepID=UPI0013D6CAD2|nr:universal stress protein [Fodinicola acaciae]
MRNRYRVAARPVTVGVDGSAEGLDAVRWGAAEALSRGIPLRLAYAATEPSGTAGIGTAAQKALDKAVTVVADAVPAVYVYPSVLHSNPIDALVVASGTSELVVVGRSHRRSGACGSVPAAVAARAECPVVVVRGEDWSARERSQAPVVLGVDVGVAPDVDAVIRLAFEMADRRHAPLSILRAISTENARLVPTTTVFPYRDWRSAAAAEHAAMAGRLEPWRDSFPGVIVSEEIVEELPAPALLEASTSAQLVVVGSRRRGGLAGLVLGSVSQALMRQASCPVVVVPTHREAHR